VAHGDAHGARRASPPVQKGYRDDREHDHEQRRQLRLPQTREDSGIRAVKAQEEPAYRVDAEIDQPKHAVR
jgi:hypothetical protein